MYNIFGTVTVVGQKGTLTKESVVPVQCLRERLFSRRL